VSTTTGAPASGRIEITDLIDARKLGFTQVWVIIACSMVILLDGYDIQTMALVVPTLMDDLGVAKEAFSWALSAALIGMLVGYAFVAPLGDRIGRRPMLIAGMALVGAGSIATAFAVQFAPFVEPFVKGTAPLWHALTINTDPTMFSFFILRFITGVGLGASLPNGTALTSEYVPTRNRAFLIGMMYLSVALGALIAGNIAPPILTHLGWHWIFLVGGFIPLAICLILIVSIPESVRLLLIRKPGDPRIARLLKRLAPGVDPANVYAEKHEHVKSQSVFALLSRQYIGRTVLLWCVFIFNLFVLYALISWLPTILNEAGWTRAEALRGSVTIQAGGIIGGLIIARFMDRGYTVPAMTVGYIVTVIAFALFLVLPNSVLYWNLLLLLIGGGISGAQVSLNSLSVIFYPPVIRATGAGWANTMGRFGAIAAPIVAGAVTAAFDLPPVQQLTFLIAPTLVCVLGILILPRVWKHE
jgi:AAHS family 4-hydroxybenzoate transporter-like MFS transporter